MDEDEYKRVFVDMLVEDDGIAQALINTNPDFLSTIPNVIERIKMKDESIFDYPLDSSVNTEATSMIMMAFDFAYNSISIDKVNIIFKIYVSQDIQKTAMGISRNSFIRKRIKALFDKNKAIGIGGLTLRRNGDLPPIDNKYVVSQMQFNTYDFS